MYNPNEPMIVVNLVLKDNKGIIKHCNIYENDKAGEPPIQDKDKIKEIIENHNYFHFQNKCVNGKTSVSGLKEYVILTILSSEF
jgi:hypothetical protein